jgi:hypothetical protein
MAGLAREHMTRHDDARSLMRQLYETSIDLVPDPQSKTLTVRLHHLTARVHDGVIARESVKRSGVGPATQDIFRSLSRHRERTITVTGAGPDGLTPDFLTLSMKAFTPANWAGEKNSVS